MLTNTQKFFSRKKHHNNIHSTNEMPLDYQSEDATTSSRNGIPNGALTVLIIAAIAIVSVVITLFCMLVNNRRAARVRQRTQQQRQAQTVLRLSPTSALSSPTDTTARPSSYPPMYIVSPSYDPKFDAPPSYEEAVRVMVAGNQQQAVGANQTVITIPETSPSTSTSSLDSESTAAAQIDVEMTHHHVPTTSTSGVTV
ncbi:hypothetical protein L3Y34_005586 [Caenorhabditis briggsae]|uniref:Uncharacterized protein n=2 Tax=Caenorhabditis briggsae TaxID=6238 RepID=A0AAE9D709_CAEBR|nr:hypothetical protein L3Y34_005586 [Caenorhabditis briggsae]